MKCASYRVIFRVIPRLVACHEQAIECDDRHTKSFCSLCGNPMFALIALQTSALETAKVSLFSLVCNWDAKYCLSSWNPAHNDNYMLPVTVTSYFNVCCLFPALHVYTEQRVLVWLQSFGNISHGDVCPLLNIMKLDGTQFVALEYIWKTQW